MTILNIYLLNIHDGRAEIIDITSKLYANTMADYNEKVGEWLDTQNNYYSICFIN